MSPVRRKLTYSAFVEIRPAWEQKICVFECCERRRQEAGSSGVVLLGGFYDSFLPFPFPFLSHCDNIYEIAQLNSPDRGQYGDNQSDLDVDSLKEIGGIEPVFKHNLEYKTTE